MLSFWNVIILNNKYSEYTQEFSYIKWVAFSNVLGDQNILLKHHVFCKILIKIKNLSIFCTPVILCSLG